MCVTSSCRYSEHSPSAIPSMSRSSRGSSRRFSKYPWIALGVIVVAAIVYTRDRTLGARVGSIIADD